MHGDQPQQESTHASTAPGQAPEPAGASMRSRAGQGARSGSAGFGARLSVPLRSVFPLFPDQRGPGQRGPGQRVLTGLLAGAGLAALLAGLTTGLNERALDERAGRIGAELALQLAADADDLVHKGSADGSELHAVWRRLAGDGDGRLRARIDGPDAPLWRSHPQSAGAAPHTAHASRRAVPGTPWHVEIAARPRAPWHPGPWGFALSALVCFAAAGGIEVSARRRGSGPRPEMNRDRALDDPHTVSTAAGFPAQPEAEWFQSLVQGLPDGFALWLEDGTLAAANGPFLDRLGFARPEPLTPHALDDDAIDLCLSELPEVFERNDRWYHQQDIAMGERGILTVIRDVTVEAHQLETIEALEGRAEHQERMVTGYGARIEALAADLKRARQTIADLEADVARQSARAEAAGHAMGEFLANASHELRTPLNAVLGFSEIMLKELFGPLGHEKYREYAADIHASGGAMLDLVTDILDMARLDGPMDQPLEPGRMALADVVNTCLKMVRTRIEAKHLDVSVSLERLPHAHADAQSVKRILLHVLTNAIKFTPDHGSLKIRGWADLHRVNVTVEDSGLGIDADDLARIGTPFARSRQAEDNGIPGLGLGLALSRRLAEANHGTLTLTSTPGEGTCARLSLPRRVMRMRRPDMHGPPAKKTAPVRAAS